MVVVPKPLPEFNNEIFDGGVALTVILIVATRTVPFELVIVRVAVVLVTVLYVAVKRGPDPVATLGVAELNDQAYVAPEAIPDEVLIKVTCCP